MTDDEERFINANTVVRAALNSAGLDSKDKLSLLNQITNDIIRESENPEWAAKAFAATVLITGGVAVDKIEDMIPTL